MGWRETSADDPITEQVQAALLRDAVLVTGTRVRLAHVVIFPVIVVLGAFFWGRVDTWRLVVPLSALLVLAVRGLWLGRKFLRIDDNPESIEWFARRFRLGVALYGGALALTGTLLFVPNDFLLTLPVLMLVTGMAAGGITTQVGFPRAMRLFHVLAFVPTAAIYAVHGSGVSMTVAAILVIYGVGLTIVGRSGARGFREQSMLKIERSILASELEAARNELSVANEVLDNRVQEVTERLAQADQLASLGRLAAGVSHEINNPLACVIANANFVEERVASAVMDRNLKQRLLDSTADIVSSGERISVIVRDLANLVRQGNESELVDLHKLVRRCVRVAQKMTDKGAVIQLELAAEAFTVLGSPTRLSQMVLNVLMNAAEAIRQNNANGRITIRTIAADGDIHLDVSDNGRGIEVSDLERVFEPFFSTKRAGDGSGLGLPICRSIAIQHGGTIAAANSAVGATISIRLPLEQREAPSSSPAAAASA